MRRASSNISTISWIVGAAALGAAAMYLLDPVQGNRRRASIRDQAVSFGNRTRKSLRSTSHDLRNRAQGLRAEASRMFARSTRGRPDGQAVMPDE